MLRSRVDRLEQTSIAGRKRIITIAAAHNTGDIPGSIKPFPNGCGFMMKVPPDFEPDPFTGLTEQQRAFLRPEDELIVICWTKTPKRQAPGDICLTWGD